MAKSSSDLVKGDDGALRCWWCGADPEYVRYHDQEWGMPVHDDRRLFEKLCLEGFQSGLSWLTILRKRDNFRAAFALFDVEKVARMNGHDVRRMLNDPGIVRHRGKIESTINNARRALELIEEFGSLAVYLWQFEPARSPRQTRAKRGDIVSTSPESIAMSKDLKKRGWTFVGPTTMYAFMQAMGLVNDHLAGCVIHRRAVQARAALNLPPAKADV
jgi:DNA-3-methyladenine glycosylase I